MESVLKDLALLFILVNYTNGQLGVLNGKRFKDLILTLADTTVGTSPFKKHIEENLDADLSEVGGFEHLRNVGYSFVEKLGQPLVALQSMGKFVYETFSRFKENPSYSECCEVNLKGTKSDPVLKVPVDKSAMCYKESSMATTGYSSPPDDILKVFTETAGRVQGLGFQYIALNSGTFYVYPAHEQSICGDYDPRTRPWYSSTANHYRRDVIVLLDSSNEMEKGEITGMNFHNASKILVQNVLSGLTPYDRAALILYPMRSLNDSESKDKWCFLNSLSPVSDKVRAELHRFLDIMKPSGSAHLAASLSLAFDLVENYKKDDHEVLVAIVTGTTPDDSIQDAQSLLKKFIETTTIPPPLIPKLVLYQLGNDLNVSSFYEKLSQSYTKKITKVIISKSDALDSPEVKFIYKFFYPNKGKIRITSQYVDIVSKEAVTGVGVPIINKGIFQGVISVDIFVKEYLSGFLTYRIGTNSYFSIYDNTNLNVLLHPLIPLISERQTNENPVITIDLLEDAKFIENPENTGYEFSENSTRIISRGNPHKEGVTVRNVPSSYFYMRTSGADLDYILLLVQAKDEKHRERKLKKKPTDLDIEFFYQRYDINTQTGKTLCRVFYRSSIVHSSSVKFAPKSFINPGEYLFKEETIDTIKNYVQIVYHFANNEIFVKGVLDDIYLTSFLDKLWTTGQLRFDTVTHAVWRYIGTSNGVFRILPAALFPKVYDPTGRPWYQSAKSQKGVQFVIPPSLDEMGAGYVVSVAEAIYEPNSDDVFGVLSMDITLQFFQLYLENKFYADCKKSGYSCFTMDHAGYIVSHKEWITTAQVEEIKVEGMHITEMEADIAEHMLKNGYLVHSSCLDVLTNKEQTHYKSNIPEKGYSVTINGKLFYKAVFAIGTNVYIIEKADLEKPEVSPCQCSGPRCELDLKQCECPCYKPPKFNPCFSQRTGDFETPMCTPIHYNPFEVLDTSSDADFTRYEGVDFCVSRECSRELSIGACHFVSQCRWCTHDKHGNLLNEPFCGEFDVCWFGQVGRPTLYPQFVVSNLKGSSQIMHIIEAIVASFILLLIIGSIIIFFRKRHSRRHYLGDAETNQINHTPIYSKGTDVHKQVNKPLQKKTQAKPIQNWERKSLSMADFTKGRFRDDSYGMTEKWIIQQNIEVRQVDNHKTDIKNPNLDLKLYAKHQKPRKSIIEFTENQTNTKEKDATEKDLISQPELSQEVTQKDIIETQELSQEVTIDTSQQTPTTDKTHLELAANDEHGPIYK